MAQNHIYLITYTSDYDHDPSPVVYEVHTCEKKARIVAFAQQAPDRSRLYTVETWTTGENGECVSEWDSPRKPVAPAKSRELVKAEKALSELEATHARQNAAFEASSRSYENIEASVAAGDYSFLD